MTAGSMAGSIMNRGMTAAVKNLIITTWGLSLATAPGNMPTYFIVSFWENADGSNAMGAIMAAGMMIENSSGNRNIEPMIILFFMISSNSFSMIAIILENVISPPP